MGCKIGIGIITCDRENLFRKSFSSIPDVDEIIVVNDGLPYPDDAYRPVRGELIQHRRNQGVGKSKNDAFRYLLGKGCAHIFISEDDVQIVNPDVMEEYIRSAEVSGIRHLNFGYHGPSNKTKNGRPNPKKVIQYPHEVQLAFHGHLAGAFSYYDASVLKKVGLIDEWFKNAYDHLDHTCQIIKAGYHPSFGWFADIAKSHLYIKDLDEDLSQSVIRRGRYAFQIRYWGYAAYFMAKHGHIVEKMPIISERELEQELRLIKREHGVG